MYQKLDTITLRNGESVEAGVIQGPDSEWAERLVKLLWHKGDPWNWQNAQVLERDLGLDAFFYVLHRAGKPLANIMTIEYQGVGHFGHVWTEPSDRQKGASSALMALQMAHFTQRGGRALFLGTEYDSIPYQMYARFGFEGIAAESGYMAYYQTSAAAFNQQFFTPPLAPDDLVVEPLDWRHWPTSAPLFLGDFPGVIRSIRAEIFGRASTEGGLLPLLLEGAARQQQGEAPTTVVLHNRVTAAVLGLATYQQHPLWPDSRLLDLYCHPDYWDRTPALLQALSLPTQERIIAYADRDHTAKYRALTAAGFTLAATLPQWLTIEPANRQPVDVAILVRK